MAFEDLSLKIGTEPRIPQEGRSRGENDPLAKLLGAANIHLELGEASILQELQREPAAEKLVDSGWTRIILHAAATYYDPAMARKVASSWNGEKLGPISKLLHEKVGIDKMRLRAARFIGLKYVSENPDVDISWLPESITKPRHAFITLAKEQEGDFTIEVRPETVVKRENGVFGRDSWIDVDYDMNTFFTNGHPDMGEPITSDADAVSDEELTAFSELYAHFQDASRAVISAAVSGNFSITPPTPNELWSPGK